MVELRAEEWQPNEGAIAAWRTFPSVYEWALLDNWLHGWLGTERDYEARLALNVIAQRKMLASQEQTPDYEAAANAVWSAGLGMSRIEAEQFARAIVDAGRQGDET